ncbi:MAG: hypothetical protein PHP93_08230 [Kiritimatiellales bacterium]|nr:hypothetical protein [Kiritimatiellales bacterium]
MNTQKLSGILIRAFWAGILLLALWANLFILFSVRMYASHAQWFSLSYHEFELFMYGAMIFLKLSLLLFFLLPYLAIKWAEYSKKHSD